MPVLFTKTMVYGIQPIPGGRPVDPIGREKTAADEDDHQARSPRASDARMNPAVAAIEYVVAGTKTSMRVATLPDT